MFRKKGEAAGIPKDRAGRLLNHFRLTKTDAIVAAIAIPLELVNIMPSLFGVLSSSWPLALAYLFAGFVVLTWRKLFPRLVLTALLVHQALFSPIFYQSVFMPPGMVFNPSQPYSVPYIPLFVALVAVMAVASASSFRSSLLFCLPAAMLPTFIFSAGRPLDAPVYVFASALWVGGAWSFGRFVGRSTQRISDLESERRKAEVAMAAERAHIAAELHDIVSHAVTVMLLHAAGGRRIIESDPLRAARALEVIASVGSEATQELSRLLGLLNPDSVTKPGKPLPTLEDIVPLIEAVRSGGVQVEIREAGFPKKLDASVGHTAYRAIQESLTNVSKHAGPGASVIVEISWEPSALRLQVTDDGGGRYSALTPGPSGYGLLGLKERVAVAGGRIDWGPHDGGFVVDLSLPLAQTGLAFP